MDKKYFIITVNKEFLGEFSQTSIGITDQPLRALTFGSERTARDIKRNLEKRHEEHVFGILKVTYEEVS